MSESHCRMQTSLSDDSEADVGTASRARMIRSCPCCRARRARWRTCASCAEPNVGSCCAPLSKSVCSVPLAGTHKWRGGGTQRAVAGRIYFEEIHQQAVGDELFRPGLVGVVVQLQKSQKRLAQARLIFADCWCTLTGPNLPKREGAKIARAATWRLRCVDITTVPPKLREVNINVCS